jgi:hypothetical protein
LFFGNGEKKEMFKKIKIIQPFPSDGKKLFWGCQRKAMGGKDKEMKASSEGISGQNLGITFRSQNPEAL